MNSFQELAAARQSIRQFTDDPVSDGLLKRILTTACRAPSAHNRQPWRFVVLRQGKGRQGLGQAMARHFRQDLTDDGVADDRIERLVERGFRRLVDPPIAVLLCLSMEEMDQYPDERRQQAERMMAVQSAALAGGHLLLAAHSEGLGACWVCAPLFVPEVVQAELALPASWEAQGLIIMGWPAENGRNRGRKALEEVVVWR